MPDRLGASSNEITFVGNRAQNLPLRADTAVKSGSNGVTQTSIVAHIDPLLQTPLEAQPIDLEWLLTDLESLKPVQERTHVHSPSMERGHKNPNHSQTPSNISIPRHFGSSDHVRVSENSGQSTPKTTTIPMAHNTRHETLPRTDIARLEQLSLLVECSKRLGFSSLNEALSVYYTSDLSKSEMLSHEQSLNRVRQLPNFLSDIREHSKCWPTWERANYVRETLRSAEDIYAEECKLARINLREQGILSPTQNGFQVDQMFQITSVLQQEVCCAF
jgi:hypothetical protein